VVQAHALLSTASRPIDAASTQVEVKVKAEVAVTSRSNLSVRRLHLIVTQHMLL